MPFRRLRFALLLGSCLVLVDSCSESTSPLHGPPAQFDVVAGDAQTGVVGTELGEPLTVRLVDANGITIAGQLVNFRVTAGGGSVFAGSAITNNDGLARERFTLGTSTADSQVVQARAIDTQTGAALVLQVFHARALADQPVSATVTSGASQNVAPGATASDSLSVTVRDKYGNPVPGVPVDWSVTSAGGTLTRATDTTSAAGIARTGWTAPTKAGGYIVTGTPRGLTPLPISESVFSAPPAQLALEWSGGSTAPVATSIEPSVRVFDAFGNPISSIPVSLSVASGNGQITTSPVLTDSAGRARVSWTLGTVAGVNTLRASAAGLTTLSFNVTGTPGPAAVMTKLAGDNQTTPPGTSVPVSPAVRIIDAYGNPNQGVLVSFAATGGGGSLSPAATSTDSMGVASVTSWTVGATRGINTLQASAAPGSVTFTATSALKSPDITVFITRPFASVIAGDSLKVVASVNSVKQLSTVQASVGSLVVPMTYAVGAWSATIPLGAVPRGDQQLVVTVTDIDGAATDATSAFIHDKVPQITIATPITGDVVKSTVSVSAACADDDPAGCTSLTVAIGNQPPVMTGTSSVSGSVSLAAFAPAAEVTFTATDSRGQTSSVKRVVQIEPSTHLVSFSSAVNGKVWDYRDGNMLVTPDLSADVYPNTPGLPFEVVHTSTGIREQIPLAPNVAVAQGYVSPRGAILSGGLFSLFDYRDGQVTTLANVNAADFQVEGGYATFVVGATGKLYLRDLNTGVDLLVASGSDIGNSVTTAGDVAFWNSSYDIDFYTAGTVTPLTSDDNAVVRNYFPVTDGQNVVFAKSGWCCSSRLPNQIVLASGGTTLVLATDLASLPASGRDYAVRNGWTAFTRPDGIGSLQVWTRAPDGTQRQVSAFGTSSYIAAVGDDGSVIFFASSGKAYMATASAAPVEISSGSVKYLWRDGGFVGLLGRMVFKVVP